MNDTQASEWLPSFLVPFITLSYPTERPAEPDSFHDYSYYKGGILDLCFIVTCIAVMAILRDALRLGVCEPFARWYLTRRLRKSKARQNAHANGHVKIADITDKKNLYQSEILVPFPCLEALPIYIFARKKSKSR